MKNTLQLSPGRPKEKLPDVQEQPLAWDPGKVKLKFISSSELDLDLPFQNSASDYRSIHKCSLVHHEEIL